MCVYPLHFSLCNNILNEIIIIIINVISSMKLYYISISLIIISSMKRDIFKFSFYLDAFYFLFLIDSSLQPSVQCWTEMARKSSCLSPKSCYTLSSILVVVSFLICFCRCFYQLRKFFSIPNFLAWLSSKDIIFLQCCFFISWGDHVFFVYFIL